MSRPYIISVSSDEEEDDDVQVLAFHEATQRLIDQAPPKVVKKLCEAECPICFDSITNATTTSCGHVYCLDCLQKSILASSARGQTRGKKGVGLCPMCRKSVTFKDTVVLRLRKGAKVAPPETKKADNGENLDNESLNDDFASFDRSEETNQHANQEDTTDNDDDDDELIGLF